MTRKNGGVPPPPSSSVPTLPSRQSKWQSRQVTTNRSTQHRQRSKRVRTSCWLVVVGGGLLVLADCLTARHRHSRGTFFLTGFATLQQRNSATTRWVGALVPPRGCSFVGGRAPRRRRGRGLGAVVGAVRQLGGATCQRTVTGGREPRWRETTKEECNDNERTTANKPPNDRRRHHHQQQLQQTSKALKRTNERTNNGTKFQ